MNRDESRPRAGGLAGLMLLVWVGCAPAVEREAPPPGDTGRSEAALSLATGAMVKSRYGHSATRLVDGKVLIVGGSTGSSSGPLPPPELYDPATGIFTDLSNTLNYEYRLDHVAVNLADGKVLLVGGWTSYSLASRSLLYDPASRQWSFTSGYMNQVRSRHSATVLPDGRVLVAGGTNGGSGRLSNCELYEPATGTFKPVAALKTARYGHTATLLPDGRVLVAGGYDTPTAELYDPATDTWTLTGSLATPRESHRAVSLPDGQVLVVGGLSQGTALATAERYNPATGTWSATGAMSQMRQEHAVGVLASGKVLVVGGTPSSYGNPHASLELFDPTTGTWSAAGTMFNRRSGPAVAVLDNGRVLITGGQPVVTGDGSAELYTSESACAALTCAGQGMNCGTLYNGCGRTLQCGTCASGQTCLGTNVCTAFTGAPAYDATRKAPRCTQAGPLCDSEGLIKGRERFGPEPNTPNTLASSCADGNGGYDQTTTSVDRLRVITVDGSPLAVGKTVRLEATGTRPHGQSDKLDVFYATHPDAPVWRYLTTFSSYGTGAETGTTTFTLSAGASLQAVRGVMRYGGTAAPCVPGSYNDHDDLVFPVDGPTAPQDYPPSMQWVSPADYTTLQGTVPLKVTATDDRGVSRVEFYVGTTLLGTVTSAPYEYAWNTTLVANSSYSLSAKVYDTSGQTAVPPSVYVFVKNDLTPPTVTLNQPTADTLASTVVVMQVTASDDQDLARLEVYVDDQLVNSQRYTWTYSTTWNFNWDASGLASGTHRVFARAYDASGRSAQTPAVSILIDQQPPTAAVTSPQDGATLNGTTLTVNATATDDRGVAAVQLYFDDQFLAASQTPPYVLTADIAYFPAGTYALRVYAVDEAGNGAWSAPVTVHISPDVTPPTVSILAPAPNATVSGTRTITVSAQDDRQLAYLALFVDGVETLDVGPSQPLNWDTTTVSTGGHVLVVRAYDAANNQTDSAPVRVLVDNTVPTPPPGTALYDATRKAPGCASPDTSCDSAQLLNGRGPLGPESHAPNTLFTSCQDGTSGGYHGDESLDRLKVSTLDGSLLTAGKTVRVEATVWAYSTGSSDALDLYYTANANSPSWTFLTTLVPPGGGSRVLSATYTLPSGALQAVRGVFRYGGSAGVCGSGSYTDHDDLFFAVK